MESITECEINLFSEALPSMDELSQLALSVNSSESGRLSFSEQVDSNLSKTGSSACLASGIGLYILGRHEEAAKKLEKADDCKEKYFYLGLSQRKLGRYDDAIGSFDKAGKSGGDTLAVAAEKACTYRKASDFEAAEKVLKSCANFENVSAEYHYQIGRIQEATGLYEEAMDNYKTAIELSPEHQAALFHLAYRCDMSGDEEAAMDYYRQITSNAPVYVSALLNLAILYEDAGKFEKAAQYIDKVLEFHPNHPRATLFRKDIESSKTMFYDEEKEMKISQKVQILETPISDFELSVRSRNCLQKMNISTIGDLLNITETELLSYKNFGETSLKEIKAILDPKGMHLGMAVEEKQMSFSGSELLEPGAEGEQGGDEGILSRPVDDLKLSVRARKCLQRLNIRSFGDLTRRTEAELLGCKNFGVTSLNEIKKAITSFGLSFRSLD
ncbi:MAG: tetratricopeptide repeat protein [Planctomycetes bacterium]|nr:tetratricopeptide repeat protein [Planctomycetota bacterium]